MLCCSIFSFVLYFLWVHFPAVNYFDVCDFFVTFQVSGNLSLFYFSPFFFYFNNFILISVELNKYIISMHACLRGCKMFGKLILSRKKEIVGQMRNRVKWAKQRVYIFWFPVRFLYDPAVSVRLSVEKCIQLKT